MVTITLPPALERAVAEEAARKGTTAESLSLDALQRLFLSPSPASVSAEGVTSALREQLDRLLALREGWNGYSAPPPNREAVATATAALAALERRSLPAGSACHVRGGRRGHYLPPR